jgi:hypothetical protein
MPAIPHVGAVFATAAEFLRYLESLQFGAWRPRFVTMHHTGAPDIKTWRGWQTRAKPISDKQWLSNLAGYYGNTMGWSAGPHFFFTPKHFCVLSDPTKRGVHAASFNAVSWGVECVGDFDREKLEGDVYAKYTEGLACLHIATGLELTPFVKGSKGLHFHRDDPKTSKTCPGKSIQKPAIIAAVKAQMARMTGGDAPAEKVEPIKVAERPIAATVIVDDLNVRAAASAKAAVVRTLDTGAQVLVYESAQNGETLWVRIGKDEWVARRFLKDGAVEVKPKPDLSKTDRHVIRDFMVANGWGAHHAYGAASNIFQECSFVPNLYGDGGKAYGLCQWHGDRQARFKKQFGKPIQEASTIEQLQFMNWELRNPEKGAGDKLMATKTAYDAGAAFSRWYERPKAVQAEMQKRGQRAQEWFDEDVRAGKVKP